MREMCVIWIIFQYSYQAVQESSNQNFFPRFPNRVIVLTEGFLATSDFFPPFFMILADFSFWGDGSMLRPLLGYMSCLLPYSCDPGQLLCTVRAT